MTANVDPYRLHIYSELLARPDRPDLPRRAHRLTQPGEDNRRQGVFPKLVMAWATRHWLEVDGEDACWKPARRPTRVQAGRFL